MTKSLDEIMAGRGASEPAETVADQPAAPAPEAREEAPIGDDPPAQPEAPAATGDAAQEGTEPAQQPARNIPPAALTAERSRRQEAEQREQQKERELLELRAQMQQMQQMVQGLIPQPQPAPQKAPPDPFDDLEAWGQNLTRQAIDPIQRQLHYNARLIAGQLHGQEALNAAIAAFDEAVANRQVDPVEAQKVFGSPNPFHEAVQWYQRKSALDEIGPDPAAYKERLKQQIIAELQAQQPAQPAPVAPSPAAPATLPSNFAKAPASAGGPRVVQQPGGRPLSAIMGR